MLEVQLVKVVLFPMNFLKSLTEFLLMSNIRSEGSIAIVKKFNLNFFMNF